MSKQQLEVRRRTAMALLDAGQKPKQIAQALGCDPSSIHKWRRAQNHGGPDALTAKVERKPRKPKLDARKRRSLLIALAKSPKHFGFDTALWTLPRIRALVKQRRGIDQSESQLSRILHALKWSPQRPQRPMRQQDKQAVEHFRAERWPAIKKKPGKKAARL